MSNYYNEIDPYAAQWLRNLITAKHIGAGDVDERSIEDVTPDDLRGYTQCHFFAGIGVWSYALRQAGWPDDRPVWTGSCPCQPFSAAGKGDGFADERHLWPAFHHLIAQCRPAVVIGEQVASKAVDAWIDLVHADLEALGYAFGSVPFPSAGVGAPHIRDRNYWAAGVTHDAGREGLERFSIGHSAQSGWQGAIRPAAEAGESGGVADTEHHEHQGCISGHQFDSSPERSGQQLDANGGNDRPGPTNGHWSDADWLFCRDGKWRPVEPGTFPLAHGATSRVGRLRGYGNAINAKAAQAFIESVMS